MSIAPLSPECRLVFLTAGGRANDEAIASLVRGPLDWARVLIIAEREHAMPSLWRALARTARAVAPADVVQHLRKRTMVSDFRMLHLQQRLQVALKALQERGVPVMLLKGAAFGASVYGSFVERPMVDVDVLVRNEEVVKARSAIVAAGWKSTADPVLADLLAGHHHLPPFHDGDSTGLRLELHTSLMPPGHPFGLDEAEIWEAASPADATFHGALVPAPRHLLYHACVHFSWAHAMQFGAWRTFRDTSELLAASRIDWNEFLALAHRSRAASACYWMLRLSQRLSGTVVPNEVLATLRSPTPEVVRRAVERHFIATIAPGEGPPCPSTALKRLAWRLAIRPSWSGHGQKAPWTGAKNWALAMTGEKPESWHARAIRHLTGVRHWWNYVVRTLVPLA